MISPTFGGTKAAAAEIEIFGEILIGGTEQEGEVEGEETPAEKAAETVAEMEVIRTREATAPLPRILRRLPTRHPG